MFRLARPGQIPFLLVLASAATLVAWNSIHLVKAFRAARERPPARQLDQAAADIAKLLADRAPTADPQGAVPETELTVRAGLACDILNRHRSTFDNLAATIPGAADRLERIDSALSAACAIRARFARPLSAADRAEADTEMQARLTQSLAAVQSAQTRLEAGQPTPEAGAIVEEPAALRGPLIGLACGLVCLLFARRPQAAVPPAGETVSALPGDRIWQPTLEPIPPPSKEPPPPPPPPQVPIQSSALFFCDAFDRAPAPMVLLDSTGRVLRLNARAELAAGRSTDELRRQLYWGEPSQPSHEPIGGLMLLPEEEGSSDESWTIGESQNATRFRFGSEPRLFDGKFDRDTIVLPAEQPTHAPPAHANANAAAVEAAANELESELTLIGGHCEMLLEEGKSSSSGTTADLELLREASQRAIQAVRRLLDGLAHAEDYGEPRS